MTYPIFSRKRKKQRRGISGAFQTIIRQNQNFPRYFLIHENLLKHYLFQREIREKNIF